VPELRRGWLDELDSQRPPWSPEGENR
jgi:hypothetical protein